MPPKFIYFDMGNVLLRFDHHIAARQIGQVAGMDPDDVWRLIFGSDLEDRYEAGRITGREFYEEFCRTSAPLRGAAPPPDYDAFQLAGSAIFELNAPVAPIVAQLKSAGHRLGVLSNTCDSHWEYCLANYTLIREMFDVYALSYEIRAMKPEPAIYAAAAQLAGFSPEEIFFVDDREENVAGARQAGLDVVLFTTAAQLAADLRTRGVKFNY